MKNTKQYFGKDLEAMSFATNYHEWILDEFMPYLRGNIAEVGAGTGNFSDFLLRSHLEHLTAFEPDTNMYSQLEHKFSNAESVKTVNAYFEEDSEHLAGTFDTVCYVNVLEHIEHDQEALGHAYRAIKPGGHLLVFVPALSFLYSNLDRQVGHFRRYSKQELTDVVVVANFTVTKVKYFDIMGIIPWYVAFVLLKQTATSSNVSLYDNWVVPIMRRVERMVPPMIGKNLILIARKDAS